MKSKNRVGFETPNGFWYSELSVREYLLQDRITGKLLTLLVSALDDSSSANYYLNCATYYIFDNFKCRVVDSKGITVKRFYLPDNVEIVQAWETLESEHPEEVLTAAFEKANKDIGYFAKTISYRLRRLESSH